MKLYRKRLDSLEALQLEKARLRQERKQTSASDLLPSLPHFGLDQFIGKGNKSGLSTLLDLLSVKNEMQLALTLGKPLLRMFQKRKEKKQAERKATEQPKKKSLLEKVAIEIAVNYTIGKAVQVTIASLLATLKEKKSKKG